MRRDRRAVRDFDGSQVLYRLAFASRLRAAQRAKQAAERGGDTERSARSFDALIEAVVLLQASAEAWINRQYERAGLHSRGGGWVARWNGIGHLAKSLGREMQSLASSHTELLTEISTLRNYLVHGDADSTARLQEWSGDRDLHDILTVEYVADLLRRAEALWTQARAITGQQTPFTDHAWVALDEFM